MGSRARADVVGVRRSEESGVTRADNMGCMRQREGEMYSTTWGSETKRVSRTSHQPFRRQSFMPGCLWLIIKGGLTIHILPHPLAAVQSIIQCNLHHYLYTSQNAMGKPDDEALTYIKVGFWNNLVWEKKSSISVKNQGPPFFMKHFWVGQNHKGFLYSTEG